MSLAGALTAAEVSSGMGPTILLAEASFIPTGHASIEPIDPVFTSCSSYFQELGTVRMANTKRTATIDDLENVA